MANDPIEFDITDTLDKFNKLANDMPFLISKSMNDLAFERGRKALVGDMEKTLKKRERWYFNPARIKVKRSSKKKHVVTLFHQDESLGLQEHGGVELPKSKKLAVPIRRNFNKYVGVSNSKKIPKSLSIQQIMSKAPRSRSQAKYKTKGVEPFILPKGVYIRTDDGASGIRMLYAFKSRAKHTKKPLDFQKTIDILYAKNFERYFARNYLRVLKG